MDLESSSKMVQLSRATKMKVSFIIFDACINLRSRMPLRLGRVFF